MRPSILAALGAIVAFTAVPAVAALPTGSTAPDFLTMGALAGKPFRLHLKEQLSHGPVVLFFYPKASPVSAPARATAPVPKSRPHDTPICGQEP